MILSLTIIPLASIAACGQQSTDDSGAQPAKVDAEAAAAGMGNMENMPMPEAGKVAKGTGTVTALDKAAGKITLDHGPIPEADWPAMTMAFTAKPEVLEDVSVGDRVDFDLLVKRGTGEVTAVRKY
jgi:Cu/Ag efflux protein CusF